MRYVDDMYVFVPSLSRAESLMRTLTLMLRDYDLNLNESKSLILNARYLLIDEPDLEEKFRDAMSELADQQAGPEFFSADYGFQSEWEEAEDRAEAKDIELLATQALFDSISGTAQHDEKSERFCLPLFSAAGSDYAVDYVLKNFRTYPAMSQIYSNYLSKFLANDMLHKRLGELLADENVYFDWQRMWILPRCSRQGRATTI